MSDLFEELKPILLEASRTPLGQKAVNSHAEDFDVEVAGRGAIHVTFTGRAVEIGDGPSPRQEPLHYSLVQLDPATLEAILGGRLSPVDAMETGKLFLRTRLYGGALITILLRAAYDLARQRKLEAA